MTNMNEQILKDWKQAEQAGLVRLKAEHEQENYFDVYGEPEGYENIKGEQISPEQEKRELIDVINRLGCYCVFSQYWNGVKWITADSVGMCAGYENPLSPTENCYVLDLMASALALIPQVGEH